MVFGLNNVFLIPLEYIKSPKYFEHGDILFAITGKKLRILQNQQFMLVMKMPAGGDIVVVKAQSKSEIYIVRFIDFLMHVNEVQER